MTDCPACGSAETSVMPHEGPRGSAKLKCFGSCDGGTHMVELDGGDDVKENGGGQATLGDFS